MFTNEFQCLKKYIIDGKLSIGTTSQMGQINNQANKVYMQPKDLKYTITFFSSKD